MSSLTRRSGALLLLAFTAACGEVAGPSPPGARNDLRPDWQASSAELAGIDPVALAQAADSAAAVPVIRSLLVARYGRLVLERYFAGSGSETLFDVRSVTKSVVSTLAGIAQAEGHLPDLNHSIAGYLAQPWHLTQADSAITLRHLLTMTSGFRWDDETDYGPWLGVSDHVQDLLDRPHDYLPGAAFQYNTAAVHLLGVILRAAVNEELAHYAAGHLLVPLGVQRITWETLDRGYVNGGAGLALTGRDLLKFGQLMLQDGWSGDVSVVPADWVHQATTPHFTWRVNYGAEHGVSYGYLWWTADGPPSAFFAWGYGGQLVYVVPALELVVVTTTNWHGMDSQTAFDTAVRLMGLIRTLILPTVQ